LIGGNKKTQTEKMSLCKIRIEHSGNCSQFTQGTLLMDALAEMGVFINAPCGGNGRCGKCRILVEGWFSQTDDAKPHQVKDYKIPACRAHLEGDAIVRLDREQCEYANSDTSRQKHFPFAAVDIGTTTVKLRLSDFKSTHDYSFSNPQRRYGHDVISRIGAAADPVAASKMQSLIRGAIKNYAGQAETVSFSGNTTMLYLLLGLDTSTLGHAPFTAPVRDFCTDSILNTEKVLILPVADAFIGADIVGGVSLAAEMDSASIFFIDIGTNGEMALIVNGRKIIATSCAMGPALEGMNISCGISVCEGAVTHIEEQCGRFNFRFTGDTPLGLTGTAMIDLLAILLKNGVIDNSGKVHKTIALPQPAISEAGGIRFFENIIITQQDIRNLQLAKGASLAGARFLLDQAGLDQKAVNKVYIAGAFGENLDLGNFRRLGFLPRFENADWSFLGNTSLRAAERVLTDTDFFLQAKNVRDRMDSINLSSIPDFQREYLKALSFDTGQGGVT